ncbi:hypothetical protein BpHYR1_030005 [Brachionus plicatilis]|uniref:Uncharacterized protein n=1 Tax=Brachionus plicatilis TaxID=10195 RepID=A0A3M7QUG4_BRAPC|nr:hypothetical protein BpHYR1_030005 [Brachionus plicatilis]
MIRKTSLDFDQHLIRNSNTERKKFLFEKRKFKHHGQMVFFFNLDDEIISNKIYYIDLIINLPLARILKKKQKKVRKKSKSRPDKGLLKKKIEKFSTLLYLLTLVHEDFKCTSHESLFR